MYTIVCNVSSGNLTCSDNKLIHVESISFWMYSGDDCNDETRTACGQNLTNGDTGLIPRCNGQTSCIETTSGTPSDCNGTTSALFNYRCIDRDTSVIDMCESIERDGMNRYFLTSPGYPQLSNNIQSECRCNIRGSNITAITVLDMRLLSAMDGTRSSLYIEYVDKTENITSRNTARTLYNYKLESPSTTATTADIRFNNKQINGQTLWLELEGIALHVSCKRLITTTPIYQSTPKATSSTQSTPTFQSSTPFSSILSTILSTSSSPESPYSSSVLPSSTDSSQLNSSPLTQSTSALKSSVISPNTSTTIPTSSSPEYSYTSSVLTSTVTVQTSSTISSPASSSPAATISSPTSSSPASTISSPTNSSPASPTSSSTAAVSTISSPSPTIASTISASSISTSIISSPTTTPLAPTISSQANTSPVSSISLSGSTIVSTSSSSEILKISSTVPSSTEFSISESSLSTAPQNIPSNRSTSSPPQTAEADKLTGIIAGAVVSGIIIIIVLVVAILCFVRIRRKRSEAPPTNINLASNNYFVLPKDRDSATLDADVDLDYRDSNLNTIKSDSSPSPRFSVAIDQRFKNPASTFGKNKNQDYAQVNKFKNSNEKTKPAANTNLSVETMETLQELDMPVNQPSEVEIMTNDLYVSCDKSPDDNKVN